jgi:mxaA protein
MTLRLPQLGCGAALLWTGLASSAPAPRVELHAPRDFGYTMGDIVEQEIAIDAPAGYALETGLLPKPGALTESLEVRAADWDARRRDGATAYRVTLAYQVFKGVRAAETAQVPALPLRFHGPAPLETQVPAWEFTVAPLIPPQLADAAVVIRDELPPAPLPTAPHAARLLACLAGLLALLGHLAWRRFGAGHRDLPFARAQRELRRLLRASASASPDAHRAAARRLHQALNETAGHILFAEQIGGFCQRQPKFAGLREDLAGFFALSRRLFFTAPEAPAPLDYPPARLLELCRRCAAVERRRA